MKRNFAQWLAKFRRSISGYDYYVDFEKVVENVENFKVELNILNSLIGSKNIENDFAEILKKYPETLKCIPLLLAVRGTEIYAQDADGEFLYDFEKMQCSVLDPRYPEVRQFLIDTYTHAVKTWGVDGLKLDFIDRFKSNGIVTPAMDHTSVEDAVETLLREITTALKTAIPQLDGNLKGFADPDAVLTAPETRSSSPVRILRDESRQSSLRGLYPTGEGAGYAGGIMSAAIDGMMSAEALIASLEETAYE